MFGQQIYWAVFLGFALASFVRPVIPVSGYLAIALILTVFVGLRHEVGADWHTYLAWQESIRGTDLVSALGAYPDPAYTLLNWVGANWGGGIYFVNLVCAVLAVGPLVVFCRRQHNPALALAIAVPYLVTVVFMGYTRQGAAIGLGMWAMLALEGRSVRLFLTAVTLAALFHKTAICLFVLSPTLLADGWGRKDFGRLFGVLSYGAILACLVSWNEAASLFHKYVLSTGDAALASRIPLVGARPTVASSADALYSAGAVPRLMQSVVAGLAFAIIARRNGASRPQTVMWAIVSVAVSSLFLLAFWRSTLADRLGLFFMPLQLYAFSNLPGLFHGVWSRLILMGIVLCYAASFFVWLNYSSDAYAWLPYRSVLFP